MKLPAALLAVAVLSACVIAYRLAAPEVEVRNATERLVVEVVVQLPSSRVVFGPIRRGEAYTIYHSAAQADGPYAYVVRFAEAPDLRGRCGHLSGSHYGKRMELVISAPEIAECRESSKFYPFLFLQPGASTQGADGAVSRAPSTLDH